MFASVSRGSCFLLAVLISLSILGRSGGAAETVLPLRKPEVPEVSAQVIQARVLPERKPTYYGPFGRDYEYLLKESDRDLFSRALASAKSRRWARARDLVSEIDDQLPSEIIAWLYLRETGAQTPFKARTEFIETHLHWPDADTIRRRAEESVDDSLSSADIVAWFEKHPPLSGPGMAALATAYRALGDEQSAERMARTAWLEGTFTRAQERRFLRTFDSLFEREDHQARLDRLLWDGHTNSARRMVRRVDSDQRRLAEARIALMTSSYGVDAAIAKVPEALRNDSGLIYDRLKWRRKRGRYESAAELLENENLDEIRPDLWWKERYILARDALSEGKVTEAYRIASSHKATDALSVFEAEWYAGWIQLQFLDDHEAALPHFYRVYDAVEFPVSLSRGAYWAGRALEAGGDDELARTWYEKAAVHITTYYGQLALSKLSGETLPQLPLDPLPTISERNSFHQSDLARVVRMLAEVGNKDHLRRFVLAAAKRQISQRSGTWPQKW